MEEKNETIRKEAKIGTFTKEEAANIKGFNIVITDLDTGDVVENINTLGVIASIQNKEEDCVNIINCCKCNTPTLLALLKGLDRIKSETLNAMLKNTLLELIKNNGGEHED